MWYLTIVFMCPPSFYISREYRNKTFYVVVLYNCEINILSRKNYIICHEMENISLQDESEQVAIEENIKSELTKQQR